MIEVKESSIHGRGLFARQFITEGTVIGLLEGQITREDGMHVLWITDSLGLEVSNDFRYINHSDKPNAAYYDDATVVALSDIQPGEEITHDYTGQAGEYDDDELAPQDEEDHQAYLVG